MQELVSSINSVIWSVPLISLCLGAGLFFSFRSRFLQIRLFKEMWRLIFSSKSSESGISSFQALAVSLSGRVGTGNIAGVAAAIGFGGPGAVFWLWLIATLGASTAYIEATLGQLYKEVDPSDNRYRGGPAYYFEKCLGQKWYALLFAVASILSCGIFLPGVQSNSIAAAVAKVFGDNNTIITSMGSFSQTKIIVSAIVVIIFGMIIFGGIKRIAHFTQVVVPFMAITYIIAALVIILLDIDKLPGVISLIFSDAWTPMAGFGAAIGWGVKRGIYSNEAGQGTAPHAAAAAEVDHPAQQGLVQAFSVYIDTLFVCSATAFMILITGSYNVRLAGTKDFIVQNIDAAVSPNGPGFTQIAVDSVISGAGSPFVAVALFFFAFTTILAYYYIAETNVTYICRTLHIPGLRFALKIVMIASVFYGGISASGYIWGIGDIGVGLMAWLNIVGIILISLMARPALRALKDYEAQKKAKVKHYTFDPVKLGIKNAHFWEDRNK